MFIRNLRINHLRKCFSRLDRYVYNLSPIQELEELSFNLESLNNPDFVNKLDENIKSRKGVGNINRIVELKNKLENENSSERKTKLLEMIVSEVRRLPNTSHPATDGYKDEPHVIRFAKQEMAATARDFSTLIKDMQLIRTDGLTALSGPRSYYFLGPLADFEYALIQYFVNMLSSEKYELISVPDILPARIIENCGMAVHGDRTQVYTLDEKFGKEMCLSGTAEMALAGYIEGRTFEKEELPLRLAAVSRCYRSETSNVADEKGIFRVHQFTKIEMFGVCEPQDSEAMLSEFLKLQERNFLELGLDFQTLDMPKHELGAPAYRKYDIEAFFPGRQNFGEISSCSNCTDYQARRLQAKVRCGDETVFVHTVNGTACAVPRMIMALFESNQEDNCINVPLALQSFYGASKILKGSGFPTLNKSKKNKQK